MTVRPLLCALMISLSTTAQADDRQLIEMPSMMQEHMLTNMRDHLAALDEIARGIASENFDMAAEVAEQRLGMSSLDDHGASHMAQMMPSAMRNIGTEMHRAASRLSRLLEEGDASGAWAAYSEVTARCVACHASFKIH